MNIVEIFKTYKIDYLLDGKNISKRAIAGINCPFCGDDEGYHLGILKGKDGYYFSCWKNPKHKGSIEILLTKLLGISLSEAKILMGHKWLEIDDVIERIKDKEIVKEEPKKIGGAYSLSFPEEFKPYYKWFSAFTSYLRYRGFCPDLLDKYKLHGTIIGNWSYRLIIPYYMNGKLLTWTGRDISGQAFIRYRDLSLQESVRGVKYCLFNYDNIKSGGDKLFLVEGQLDAMKIECAGGYHATCLSTTSITDEQLKLLFEITPKFKEVYLVLDRGAESQAFILLMKLSFMKNLKIKFLPEGFKDPCEMGDDDINQFVEGYL